ncbi:MAG: dTDP-4-dehydrorhamnose reductase [Acidobacteria bacterium]|nr:dTDP-4-dehydrorhamnose reductase [Acidobacteriota bacterium]
MSSRPRVLVTGADGQVGRALLSQFGNTSELIACNRQTLDLSNADQIRGKIRDTRPDIILNAGAYTAVDRAETERDLAMSINGQAPGLLAEEAKRTGALLIHYSTDYVFDGSKNGPWIEDDRTNPLSVYGASKLAGEEAIRSVGGRYLIFRTSWVYAAEGKNFLLTMLRLGRERDSLNVVDDQVGAPTTSAELARATHEIATGIPTGSFGSDSDWAGTYHMTCAGSVSWCGFARAIFEVAPRLLDGKKPSVNPIKTSEYPTPARRPLNSLLSNEKLAARFGVRLAGWQSALDEVLISIAGKQKT